MQFLWFTSEEFERFTLSFLFGYWVGGTVESRIYSRTVNTVTQFSQVINFLNNILGLEYEEIIFIAIMVGE